MVSGVPPLRVDRSRGKGPIAHEDEPRMDANQHEKATARMDLLH